MLFCVFQLFFEKINHNNDSFLYLVAKVLKTVTRDDFTCTTEEVDNLKEKVTLKAKQIKQFKMEGERCQGGRG